MFIGHYGVAFAAKPVGRRIPLWVWSIAVQWLDVIWSILVLMGIEKLHIIPGALWGAGLVGRMGRADPDRPDRDEIGTLESTAAHGTSATYSAQSARPQYLQADVRSVRERPAISEEAINLIVPQIVVTASTRRIPDRCS